MRSIICCCSARTDSPPSRAKDPIQIALTPQSAPSTNAKNADQYRGSSDFEDVQALRSIFGDISSIHEYNTATTTAADYITALPSSASPTVRRHIKSSPKNIHISFGRAREKRSDSCPPRQSLDKLSTDSLNLKPEEQPEPTTASGQRAGLEDLLTSRSASQGGYDSDAKNVDIEIDAQAKGSPRAGSVGVSTKYLAKVAKAVDGSTIQGQSAPNTPEQHPTRSPLPKTNTPTNQRAPRSENEEGADNHSEGLRIGADNSPNEGTSPTKDASEKVVEIDNAESPRDALRRAILAKPELLVHHHPPASPVPRLPSLDEADDTWSLSFSAPRRMSSLRQTPEKNTGDSAFGYEAAQLTPTRQGKRSTQSPNLSPSQRMSLISSLDDSLVAQISRFYESESPTKQQTPRVASPNNTYRISDRDDHLGTPSRPKDSPQAEPVVAKRLSSQGSPSTRMHLSDQDNASVHLFNMRISQRLGSDSLDPMLASSNSVTSDLRDRRTSVGSMKNPLSACMPSATAAGHLRKTSNSSTIEKGRLFPDRLYQNNTRDDSSSVYTNRECQTPKSIDTNGGSHKSQNGFGIPKRLSTGPSFHSSFGARPATAGADHCSMTHLSTESGQIRPKTASGSVSALESPKTRRIRSAENGIFEKTLHAHSGRKESKFVENFAMQDPQYTSKELSETEGGNGPSSCANRSLSNDFGNLRHQQSLGSTGRFPSNTWLNRKRSQVGHSNTISRNISQISLSSFGNQILPPVSQPVQESAADMWERALRSAREERESGNGQSWAGTMEASDLRFEKHGNKAKLRPKAPNSGPSRLSPSIRGPIKSVSPSYTDLKSPSRHSLGSDLLLKSKKSIGDLFGRVKGANGHRDFSSWARFPSHTRAERNESAGPDDRVEAQDFSTPITNRSPLHQLSSTPRTPKGSWKRLHWRKKSKSLTFTRSAKRARKKWSEFQRSQSSEFRRPRSGRRTSVSIGGPVEYPELELVAGYSALNSTDLFQSGDGSSEGRGASTTELLKTNRSDRLEPQITPLPRKKGGRRFNFARLRLTSPLLSPKLKLGKSRSTSPRISKRRSKEETHELSALQRLRQRTISQSDSNLILSATSTVGGLGPYGGSGLGSATAWSRAYADECLLSPGLLSPRPLTTTTTRMSSAPTSGALTATDTVGSLATVTATATATDDFVSVTFSNSPGSPKVDLEREVENPRDGDVKSGTETFVDGDILGMGERGRDQERKRLRVLSGELRDSTDDFRDTVRREEEKWKRGLIDSIEGFGGGSEGGGGGGVVLGGGDGNGDVDMDVDVDGGEGLDRDRDGVAGQNMSQDAGVDDWETTGLGEVGVGVGVGGDGREDAAAGQSSRVEVAHREGHEHEDEDEDGMD